MATDFFMGKKHMEPQNWWFVDESSFSTGFMFAFSGISRLGGEPVWFQVSSNSITPIQRMAD